MSALILGMCLFSGRADADMSIFKDVSVWTPKESALTWSLGGCGAGVLGGLAVGVNGAKSNPDIDVVKNAGVYGLSGCLVGLAIGWIWVDNSQEKQYAERIGNLEKEIKIRDVALAKHGLSQGSISGSGIKGNTSQDTKSDLTVGHDPNALKSLVSVFAGTEIPIERLISKAPKGLGIVKPNMASFLIGFPQALNAKTREDNFIPISPRVGIRPWQGVITDADVIAPDPQFGYLGDYAPWLECAILTFIEQQAAKEKGLKVQFAQCAQEQPRTITK